jgi:hypothetical protein
MAIEFRCGGCTTRLKAPDNSSGKRVKCPKCASIQTIPGAKPAEAELGLKPEATAPKSTPAPKPAPTAKPKPAPVQAKPQAPQIAPLASSSPFGDLGNLANMDLTAGPSVQMASAVLPPSDPGPAPMPGFRATASPFQKRGSSSSLSTLKVPAMVLMVFSVLGMLIEVLYIILVLAGIFMAHSDRADGVDTAVTGVVLIFPITMLILGFLINFTIFRGAHSMFTASNYSLAKNGAMIACVPCFCIAFPFAIWALVLLSKDSVKSSFYN